MPRIQRRTPSIGPVATSSSPAPDNTAKENEEEDDRVRVAEEETKKTLTAAKQAEEQRFKDVMKAAMSFYRTDTTLSYDELASRLNEGAEDLVKRVWEALRRHPAMLEVGENNLAVNELLLKSKESAEVDLKELVESRRGTGKHPFGLCVEDIVAFDETKKAPMQSLLLEGLTLPIVGKTVGNQTCTMLYPRGQNFLIQVSGKVSSKPGSCFLETTSDLTEEIRRGDIIMVENQPYRVSVEVGDADSLSREKLKVRIRDLTDNDVIPFEDVESLRKLYHDLLQEVKGTSKVVQLQPSEREKAVELFSRNEASYSSSSVKPHLFESTHANFDPVTLKLSFKYDFTSKRIPIFPPFRSGRVESVDAFKYGCTNDVRNVYWRMVDGVEINKFEPGSVNLDSKLLQLRLISKEDLADLNHNETHRKRRLEAAMAAPQQKRARANNRVIKISNTHMKD